MHGPGRADVVVRPATAGDALAWARFLAAEQARTYAGLMPEWFGRDRVAAVDDDARQLAVRLADTDGRRSVLAERGGVVVGVAAAGPAPSAWEVELGLLPAPAPRQLDRLYLHPDEHGTGLADRLLAAVLEPGPVYLWLIDGNDRAERFYTRRGFRSLDERVLAGDSWAHAPMHRMVRD